MLKDVLNKIVKNKGDFDINQRLYWKEILKQFPVIMTQGLDSKVSVMESELNLMLRMSTKYKTTRVEIPYNDKVDRYYSRANSQGKYVVILTRSFQGLRFPYSSNKDIKLMNSEYFLKKDNILINNNEKKKDQWVVNLSFLKALSDLNPACAHPVIKGDKLKIFFKFYREITAFKKELFNFYKGGEYKKVCDNINLRSKSISFELTAMDNDWSNVDPKELVSYSTGQAYYRNDSDSWDDGDINIDEDSSSEFNGAKRGQEIDLHYQKMLSKVTCNWGKIESELKKQEAVKKSIINKCDYFINAMKQHTLPWKVLNQIKGE